MIREEIRQASADARINLTPAEGTSLEKQIVDIFKQAEFLNDNTLDHIEGTYYPCVQQNSLREDITAPSLPRDKAMQNAPEASDVFFQVPKIIE